MKRDERLYNLIFPVWMLYTPLAAAVSPLIWGILLAGNFVWDSAVLLLAFFWMLLPQKGRLYRRAILRVWLCGFLADVVATLPYLVLMYTGIEPDFISVYHPIDQVFMLPLVVLGGVLVYLFASRFALRKTGLETAEIRRIARFLAVLTAPYTFLIPTSWLA